MHIKTRVNTDWKLLLLDYAPCLRSHLSLPMIRNGKEGVQTVIDLLDESVDKLRVNRTMQVSLFLKRVWGLWFLLGSCAGTTSPMWIGRQY